MNKCGRFSLTGLMLLLVIFVFVAGCYEGYTAPDGEVLEKYLKPAALKSLVENPDPTIWIIDVRPRSAYVDGHIPTARSFPSSEVMDRLSELPKNQYLIVYCETGGRAQMVIKKLMKKGYTRLMNWGGYGRWEWPLEKGGGK
jgi:rhodanese-related sulfurtransferase